MTRALLLLICLLALPAGAAECWKLPKADQEACQLKEAEPYFNEGKTFGNTQNRVDTGRIAEVPGYSPNGNDASQRILFGPNTLLAPLADSKATGCATAMAQSNPECQAILFSRSNKGRCQDLRFAAMAVPDALDTLRRCAAFDLRTQGGGRLTDTEFRTYVQLNCGGVRIANPVAAEYTALACDSTLADEQAANQRQSARDFERVERPRMNNPPAVANITGRYTDCKETTTSNSTPSTREACYEYLGTASGGGCTEELQVTVDPGRGPIPGGPGQADLPAVAPRLISIQQPQACRATDDKGENLSGCPTQSACIESGVRRYGWDRSLEISQPCWKWQREYYCEQQTYASNTCGPQRNKGCREVGRQCGQQNSAGNCVQYQVTMECPGQSTTSKELDCSDRKYCIEGRCFDAGFKNDRNLPFAIVGLETAREAGVYGDCGQGADRSQCQPSNFQVFNGISSSCEKWPAKCCAKAGGGKQWSNFSMYLSLAQTGVGVLSNYVYDALLASTAPQYFVNGVASFTNLIGAGAGSMSALIYDFIIGNIGFAQFVNEAISIQYAAMGPWGVVLMVAQLIYQVLMSCTEEDMLTAARNDTGLCLSLGDYCARRLPLSRTCIQKKERFCCFNSKLAKILQVEGKKQIGRSMGSAESPDCGGFTAADLERIDFSRIPASVWEEFARDIEPKTIQNAMESARISGNASGVAQGIANKYQSYYSR